MQKTKNLQSGRLVRKWSGDWGNFWSERRRVQEQKPRKIEEEEVVGRYQKSKKTKNKQEMVWEVTMRLA